MVMLTSEDRGIEARRKGTVCMLTGIVLSGYIDDLADGPIDRAVEPVIVRRGKSMHTAYTADFISRSDTVVKYTMKQISSLVSS